MRGIRGGIRLISSTQAILWLEAGNAVSHQKEFDADATANLSPPWIVYGSPPELSFRISYALIAHQIFIGCAGACGDILSDC